MCDDESVVSMMARLCKRIWLGLVRVVVTGVLHGRYLRHVVDTRVAAIVVKHLHAKICIEASLGVVVASVVEEWERAESNLAVRARDARSVTGCEERRGEVARLASSHLAVALADALIHDVLLTLLRGIAVNEIRARRIANHDGVVLTRRLPWAKDAHGIARSVVELLRHAVLIVEPLGIELSSVAILLRVLGIEVELHVALGTHLLGDANCRSKLAIGVAKPVVALQLIGGHDLHALLGLCMVNDERAVHILQQLDARIGLRVHKVGTGLRRVL